MKRIMKNDKIKNIISVVLLLISVLLIIIGINNGEPATVLSKAVNICMQCIGLG